MATEQADAEEAAEDAIDQAIQALLDGRELPALTDRFAGIDAGALQVIDAIARAHRTAIFGRDITPDRPARARWGHLEIRDEIGRGASATVYRAWDTRLAREVALKLFSADVNETEALEEGRLLARLNHPHIVRVFDADIHDGTAGVWMELLDGDVLDAILARDGVFGTEEALLIGLDLARALSAVHAAGLLHRDVKSRNVLRERGGRIVLMDLGAGRNLGETAAGDVTGTPMYMAPEVLAGGAATPQSDLYSLGVLLYRLLADAFPVSAGDLARLRAAHATGQRQALHALRSDLEPDVANTIERCCHPNPEQRFQSALDVESALASTLATTLARRMVLVTPLTRASRRWRRSSAVMAAIVTVTLATSWSVWNTDPIRAARRRLGLAVPPRSTLYVSMAGGLAVIQGLEMTVSPNPASATAIAVSSDLGVVTMAGFPPWTSGGHFRLDGAIAASLPVVNEGLCCFEDGTTDGEFNYAARQDSTLLEPAGSRPLAPPALYRFNRDWSNPQLLFHLLPEGHYRGVAYAAGSRSFWVTRKSGSLTVIEEWSVDGRHLRTPIETSMLLRGLAIDPLDDTLWAVRAKHNEALIIRLENFDKFGRHLSAVEVPTITFTMDGLGAEFGWVGQR